MQAEWLYDKVLSTGEPLTLTSWDNLAAIEDADARLISTLGRTPHFKRKNRESIRALESDIYAIHEERRRRRRLWTISLCGLVLHFNDGTEKSHPASPDDPTVVKETVYEFVRPSSRWTDPSSPHKYCPTDSIWITKSELREFIERGAIKNESADPAAPWKVADIED